MNTHMYLFVFIAGVAMVAAGKLDVKKDAVAKKRFFGGGNKVHPTDMALPQLMDSLREHLVALKDAIYIVEDLQDTGIDSTVADLLDKLNGVPISGTTYTPGDSTYSQGQYTSPYYSTITPPPSTTDWWGTNIDRSIDRKRKLLSELVLKRMRAMSKEEQ